MEAKKLKEMAKMYNDGKPVKKMAAHYHMSLSRLYDHISKLAEQGLVVMRERGAVSARPNMLVMHKSRANKRMKLIEYEPLGKPVTIMELTNNTCRWPCAGGLYCGAAVHKASYCEAHYKAGYVTKGKNDE